MALHRKMAMMFPTLALRLPVPLEKGSASAAQKEAQRWDRGKVITWGQPCVELLSL